MTYEIPMDMAQWNRTHGDFKTIINGVKFILTFVIGKGSCLVPVKIIKKEIHNEQK